MVESETSAFDSEEVPEDAFSTWPRNRVFQTQSGYAIDGYSVEQWLTDNPYTADESNKVHYRFYMMNLESLTPIFQGHSNPTLILVAIGGGSALVLIAAAVVWKKRTNN